jgi:hypothetical protein
VLLEVPMPAILARLELSDVREGALLERHRSARSPLQLVEAYEKANWDSAKGLAQRSAVPDEIVQASTSTHCSGPRSRSPLIRPRSTFIGSTRVARRAGSQLAAAPRPPATRSRAPNATGSVVLTPNTSPLRRRVRKTRRRHRRQSR